MIGQGIAGGFAGLGHEISDVDARGGGLGNSLGNFRDEQIRKNTGVERAGTEQDEVGVLNSLKRLGQRANGAREESKLLDRLVAGRNARFTVNLVAAFESGDQGDVGDGRRKYAPADGENFAADAHGLGEISGHMGKRGEEEVAEIVSDQAATGVKAILKKAAEQSFVLR